MGPYTLTLDGTGTGGWQLDNPITGTGGIIKNDANGTLSLSGTNTYSGATTISSGALTIGSAGQLGSGNYAGVITNNGTLNFDSTATQAVSGAISGSGTVSYTGTGGLNLAGNITGSGSVLKGTGASGDMTLSGTGNDFTGDIGFSTSGRGAMYVASMGNGSGIIKMNQNDAIHITASIITTKGLVTTGGGAVAQDIYVDSANTLTISGLSTNASAVTYNPNFNSLRIFGTGTLVLNNDATTFGDKIQIGGNGTLSVSSIRSNGVASALGMGGGGIADPATNALQGTINIGASGNAGTLKYTGTGDISDRIINLNGSTGGATLDQSGSGLLKFTSDLKATGAGAKTLTLQGAGNGELAGAVVDSTSATALTKAGTGTWILSGVNTFTGATTVNVGTLSVNGSTAAGSAVTVNSGGTLGGTGTVSGAVTVKSGGTLAPGNSVGTNTVGSLTLESGATFSVEVDGATADQTIVTEAADLGGATLSVTQLTVPTLGSYKIITATSVIGTFNGLPENTNVKIGTADYYIHYRSTYVELNQSATPVVLLQLQALTLGGKVTVRWSTSSESKTAGFDLYRIVNGQSVKLNDTLIAAKGWPNGGIGASYSVADPGAQSGQTYSYKLVERTTDGQSIDYGPYERTVTEFVMKPLEVTAAGMKIKWLSRTGEKYRVLKSTDLASGQYQSIAENIAATPPENEYLDAAPGNSGFYRIELQP